MAERDEGRGKVPSVQDRPSAFDEFEEDEVTKISSPPATLEAGWASLPPKVRDRAALTVVAGPHVGVLHTLGAVTIVGRGKTAQIRIEEPVISREHSRIVRRSASVYVVEDLKSRNGTFVNGEPISSRQLAEGDRVSFGSSTALRFGLTDEQ